MHYAFCQSFLMQLPAIPNAVTICKNFSIITIILSSIFVGGWKVPTASFSVNILIYLAVTDGKQLGNLY